MMETMFQPGRFLRFDYPAANYAGIRPRLEPRRVRVEAVRDTELQPIEPETVMLEPTLNRGRILLTCTDLDKKAERSFYLHAMANVQQIELADLVETAPPPLVVQIEQNGQPIKVVELDDPRVGFCEAYNSLAGDTGSGRSAYPVSRATCLASLSCRAE